METNKTDSMDLNPLMRLKDALEGAQKNTAKMLGKLERFEHRLTDLDEKMKPIQTTTKHYTRAKENISLTLVEVLKTCEYFRIAAEVKDIVNGGFNSETQEEFFEALGKLSKAKRFFETHTEIKASSGMLTTIDGLLTTVVAACVTEFEKVLSSSGRSISISSEGQYNIVHPLTPEATREIKALCDIFEADHHMAHFKVYQSVRIAKLRAELKQQENTFAAQWAAAQQEGPYEKGSHPFKEYFLLAFYLLRSELQLWGSTLPSNEESLQVFVVICEALIGELSRVLTPILADEKSKTGNPVVRKSKALLVRLDVLETFNDRYEEFRDLCRPDVRHESRASLSLATMRLTVVTSCARCIESLTSNMISDGFGGGEARKLEGLADAASACDLHPAAGHVMYLCSEIVEYGASYRKMRELAATYFSSATAKQQLELPPVPPASLPGDAEDFTCVVLENLLAALEERATRFDDQSKAGRVLKRSITTKGHNLFEAEDKAAEEIVLGARRHLFLCNNLFSVLNHVRDMIDKADEAVNGKKRVVSVSKAKQHRLAPFAKKVETRLNTEQGLFCDTILSATGLDDMDMAEFLDQYNKDKAGQGRLLKAKFSTFNTGMDALLAQQGEWRVASAGLRDRLSQLMVSRLIPVYTKFFNEYSIIKFSKKHTEEYLKFPPNVVERHLTGFFGRS